MAFFLWLESSESLPSCSYLLQLTTLTCAEAETSLQASFCFASTLRGGETRLNFTHGIPADACKLTPLHSRRCSPMCVWGGQAFVSRHNSSMKWSKYCLRRAIIWLWTFFGIWKAVLFKKVYKYFLFIDYLHYYWIYISKRARLCMPLHASATPYLHLQYVCIFPNISIKNPSILQSSPFLIKENLWDWTCVKTCASDNV